jgi:hypothetical protein
MVSPPTRLQEIVLCDVSWPLRSQAAPLPHQISWEHVYVRAKFLCCK